LLGEASATPGAVGKKRRGAAAEARTLAEGVAPLDGTIGGGGRRVKQVRGLVAWRKTLIFDLSGDRVYQALGGV
jgi:hypothetical protein